MNREILVGDVLEKIKEIPDKTIDCVITSPPYWSLRDYSVEGQWGLEPDFHQYLAKMGRLMDELRRVLKDTGTCWINLGDTYSTTSGGMRDMANGKPNHHGMIDYDKNKGFQSALKIDQSKQRSGLKPKCRIGIPERFYINCIDSGWIARNNIVWSKNNTMPSSVKDRFTNKYESVFFFVKQQKYYFNLDAVREKSIVPPKPFNVRVRDSHTQRFLQGATEQEKLAHNKKGERKCDSQTISKTHNGIYDEDGKNPGDLFQINTKPYKEAHFATFPPELPTKILKCGCPDKVCKKCKKPVEPIKKTIPNKDRLTHTEQSEINEKRGMIDQTKRTRWTGGDVPIAEYEIIGYTDCGCNAGFEPGIVLDCFFGSGTVGEAAEKLGLQWIGIELNKEYVKLAKKRLGPYLNQTRLEIKA